MLFSVVLVSDPAVRAGLCSHQRLAPSLASGKKDLGWLESTGCTEVSSMGFDGASILNDCPCAGGNAGFPLLPKLLYDSIETAYSF